MRQRGLEREMEGVLELYLIIYRKDGKMDYLATLKDNWKDALCEFMHDIVRMDNNNLIDLYKKSITTLALPDAIQLMYVFSGKNITIADIFTGMQGLDSAESRISREKIIIYYGVNPQI